MKYDSKLIFVLTVLSIAVSQASYADYSIKIPLELSSGGHLPDGSIIIGGENGTVPDVPDLPDLPTVPDLSQEQCLALNNSAKSLISNYPMFNFISVEFSSTNNCKVNIELVNCTATPAEFVPALNSLDSIGFKVTNVTQNCKPQEEAPYTSKTLIYSHSDDYDDYFVSADGSEDLKVEKTFGGDLVFFSNNYKKSNYNYLNVSGNLCRFWESSGKINAELLNCPSRIYPANSIPAQITLTIKHFDKVQSDIDSKNYNYPLSSELITPIINKETGEVIKFYHR